MPVSAPLNEGAGAGWSIPATQVLKVPVPVPVGLYRRHRCRYRHFSEGAGAAAGWTIPAIQVPVTGTQKVAGASYRGLQGCRCRLDFTGDTGVGDR